MVVEERKELLSDIARGEGHVRNCPSGPALWGRFFIGLLCFSTLWSLATPLGAGPDEPDHLVRASALMHGQLIGVPVQGRITPYTRVQVTGAYASTIALPACFEFRPNVPAGCSPPLADTAKVGPAIIYVGRYPPFYYALVGWPTAFLTSPVAAFYVVRLLNGLVTCGFLALALCLALRLKSPRFLVVGVLTAITPMVLYLTEIINPNSLEVSATLCLWTAAILLAKEMNAVNRSRSLIGVVVLAAVVVALVRPDSPLWIVLVGAALSPIVVRSGIHWRSVGRRREVRFGAGAVVAAGVVATFWTVTQHATQVGSNPVPPASESALGLVRGALGQASDWVIQAIGYFGWLDARAPLLTVLAWVTTTGCLILCGLSFSRRRHRLTLVLTLVIAVVMPLALVLAVVRNNGYIGLGRYFLALFVGIPIAAAAAIEPMVDAVTGFANLMKTFLLVLVLGHVVAFWWALHRYLVGQNGSFSPTATVVAGWQPPIPAVLLDALFGLLAIGAMVMLLRLLSGWAAVGDPLSDAPPARRSP